VAIDTKLFCSIPINIDHYDILTIYNVLGASHCVFTWVVMANSYHSVDKVQVRVETVFSVRYTLKPKKYFILYRVQRTPRVCKWVTVAVGKISPSCLRCLITEIQADEMQLLL
jgi:hypothetical protein